MANPCRPVTVADYDRRGSGSEGHCVLDGMYSGVQRTFSRQLNQKHRERSRSTQEKIKRKETTASDEIQPTAVTIDVRSRYIAEDLVGVVSRKVGHFGRLAGTNLEVYWHPRALIGHYRSLQLTGAATCSLISPVFHTLRNRGKLS